jgi:hypothetical protein
MNGSRSAEERISLWLEREAVGHLPDHVLDATFQRTRSMQRSPVAWRPGAGGRTSRGLLAATLVVLTLIIGGGILVVGRPTQTDPPTPSAMPSPISSAAPIVSPTTFESEMYWYTIVYPSDWTVSPATAPGESDTFASADVYRFAVTADTVADGQTDREWVEVNIPERIDVVGQGCSSGTTKGTWQPTVIDGVTGLVRTGCMFTDGAVKIGGRIYTLTLSSPGQARWLFDRFAATIRFDHAVPTEPGEEPPSPSVTTFHSAIHGYTISLPRGWTTVPAKDPTQSDVFGGKNRSATRLWIGRRSKPSSQGLDAFAQELLPHRAKPDGCHWTTPGIIYIPDLQRPFERTTIAGRDAVVRAECGVVDAVIDLEDEALVLILRSGKRMAGGDRHRFDGFAETLRIDAP